MIRCFFCLQNLIQREKNTFRFCSFHSLASFFHTGFSITYCDPAMTPSFNSILIRTYHSSKRPPAQIIMILPAAVMVILYQMSLYFEAFRAELFCMINAHSLFKGYGCRRIMIATLAGDITPVKPRHDVHEKHPSHRQHAAQQDERIQDGTACESCARCVTEGRIR